MPRPQFTLRALLVAMLVVGAFLAGMRLECELLQRKRPWVYDDGNLVPYGWNFPPPKVPPGTPIGHP
jgi:hypothetical protein